METREIIQYHIYLLRMAHTADRVEAVRDVAVSFSYDRLVEFYKSQWSEELRTNPYGHKVHFIPGPLEFYNPVPLTLNETDLFGHGIVSGWINVDCYDDYVKGLIVVPE